MTTKSSAASGARKGWILVTVYDTDASRPLTGAAVSVYRLDAGDCSDFVPANWVPDKRHHEATLFTDTRGAITFPDLKPSVYVVKYGHYPDIEPACVVVQPGCGSMVCIDIGVDASVEMSWETADCEVSKCRTARVTDSAIATVAVSDNTGLLREHVDIVATGAWVASRDDRFVYTKVLRRPGQHLFDGHAMFARLPDVGEPPPPAAGSAAAANLALSATPAARAGTAGAGAAAVGAPGIKAALALAGEVDAEERPPTLISGNVGVSLSRTETEPTEDLPLWTVIRNSTDALSFTNYSHFLDSLFCNDSVGPRGFERERFAKKSFAFEQLRLRRTLPFVDADAYRVLKAATEAFVMVNCGVTNAAMAFDPIEDAAYLDRRDIPAGRDLATVFGEYMENVNGAEALPYLAVIRRKLPDVPIIVPQAQEGDAEICYGILQKKLACPCMLELIWSYWHEEGMLVQTMNAITQRFQNVRSRGAYDPLANLEIDPLRPLNNLIWGYTQDEQHRLTVVRRNYEYDHHYGIRLDGKAVQSFRPADSRSKFLEAFHFLLRLCTTFFKQDDDTTVKADAFPVLNALKEVHLILSQGAHNQFGDLPSTARVEMLMQQWLLSRAEFREFLPTRLMVAYPEAWMERVDAMKKLQGWTDTSVMHFRSLAMFGEQLLLTIRYGHWSDVFEPNQAFNWARFWRPQIQGYIHAYRAATGVDLAVDARDPAAEGTIPSVLLRKRLALQQPRAL